MRKTIRSGTVGRHTRTCIHHEFRNPTKPVCLFVIRHHMLIYVA